MDELKTDKRDLWILEAIQRNCKVSVKTVARRIKSPMTTVYSKIKRMEKLGIIRGYKAVLDAKKLGKGTTTFILATFEYRVPGEKLMLSQREVAKRIAGFAEVQEVHLLAGDWDILIKVKGKDVDEIGKFVIDKLRTVGGIERTVSMIVYDTKKESLDVPLLLE